MRRLENINYENIDLKIEIDRLEEQIKFLQLELIKKEIPVVVIVDGYAVSGKGNLIGEIVKPLDPRYFKVITINNKNEKRSKRPFLYTFAINEPAKSNITIFDRSWHRRALQELEEELGESFYEDKEELKNFFELSNNYEKQLIDNGTIVAKIFIEISKDTQKERLKEISENEFESWRITKGDFTQNKNYEKYKKAFSNVLDLTSVHSPWYIISGDKKKIAKYEAFTYLVDLLSSALANNVKPSSREITFGTENHINIKNLYFNGDVDVQNYKKELKNLQSRFRAVQHTLYSRRKSLVLVYEGQDASGKGGNIKRVTEQLDPRGYEVFSISAPTKIELSHNHMWRFWKKLPKDGHVAIFDRSWYGRVLVERIEGFCSEDAWKRAYDEINDVEEHISNHGTYIYKFFLEISKDEQLARFKDRQINPMKHHKITDEDWRNRERWNEYEVAFSDMFKYTTTENSKWHIISADNKKYARLAVLKILVEDLEDKLNLKDGE